MKLSYLIIIPVLLFARCGEAQRYESEDLIGTWYHSVEEQTDDVMVFRPEGYELPRVRGREKMIFTRDHEYIYFQIAPTDGYLELKGDYKLDEKNNELVVTYQKYDKTIKRKYRIIELGQDVLKMKMIG